MSYRKLRVWKKACEVSIEIHKMTQSLPAFEQFEEGAQIRRSIKSVRSNIVEGYGRRYHKLEFVRFIIYAIASNDETVDHLDILYETGSLKDGIRYLEIKRELEKLGKMLHRFLLAIQNLHSRPWADSLGTV